MRADAGGALLAGLVLNGTLSVVANAQPHRSVPADSRALEELAELPIARETSAGAVQRYSVHLDAGDYWRVRIERFGPEIAARLLSPQSTSVDGVTVHADEDIELSTIATASGRFVLEIRSLDTSPAPGTYRLTRTELHPATTRDRQNLVAGQLLNRAEAHLADSEMGSTRLALRELHVARRRFEVARNIAGQARVDRMLGEVSSQLGRPADALRYLGAANKLAHATDDSKEECRNLTASAAVLIDIGKLDEAAARGREAIELSRTATDRRCESRAENVLGDVESFSGHSVQSLEHYDAALRIGNDLPDRRAQAQARLNIGFVNLDLAKFAEAQNSYQAALALYRSVGDKRGEALTLAGLGNLHAMGGDSQQALVEYREAKALVAKSGDRVGLARILNGLGFVHDRLGDLETAVQYYRHGSEAFRAINNRDGEASSLIYLGTTLAALGQYSTAAVVLSRALTLTRAISDRRLEAATLVRLGRIGSHRGDDIRALEYLEEALALSRADSHGPGETDALTSMGSVYMARGDKARALQIFDEALAVSRRSGDRLAESVALYNLARTKAGLDRVTDALEDVKASLDVAESLRGNVSSLDLRASYMASVRDRYELEIDLLLREHPSRPTNGSDALAFEASERARARSFLDGLAQARAGIHEGASTAILERERLTAQELSAAALKLQALPLDADKAERESLSHAVDALAGEYRDVEAQIRSDSPKYAALVQPTLLSLQQTQQLIDEDSVLLQYFVGGPHSYVWAVTAHSFSYAILPPGKDLTRLVQRFTTAVAAVPGSSPGQHPAAATPVRRDEGRELSQELLGPVSAYLSRPRLLVVADGPLQRVPFAALPDPRSLSSPRLTPLLADHEIVNLPSISTVALLRGSWNQAHQWPKPLMILADPVFEPDDPRLVAPGHARPAAADASRPLTRAFRDVGTGSGPSRLLATRREARGIAALVPGTEVAMDFRASRATVLGLASGQHRIVHFATHGIADSQHPELSGVVLSLYDRNGKFQDGFLRLPDIYNLQMPADLVVLSACNTGVAQDMTGDALAGLVRGFMYAGSRRVLASLWRVDDEATAELMQRFYRNLLVRGLSAGDALRTAQLELRRIPRWRNPFYWGAFVLHGDWTEEARPN